MKPVLLAAVIVVHVALIAYTLGIVTEQRLKRVVPRVLAYLTIGVVFDVLATVLMVISANRVAITLHGLLGYSALAGMLLETALAWRQRARQGDAPVPRWFHLYARFAYLWWLVAYVTGGVLVAVKR